MTNKTDKQFLFEVKLNWIESAKAVITAPDTEGSVQVATAPEFGGVGKPWSPEHYFLSAISGCFMTTYLAYAKKLDFDIKDFNCDIIGQIEIVAGKYKFTHINIYPNIYIADETIREKANMALEKTHKYSLVSNSIDADIIYHSKIQLLEQGNQIESKK